MTAPTAIDNPITPLAFYRESTPGSNQLLLDPDVAVTRVKQGSNRDLCEAKVRIRTLPVASADPGQPDVYPEITRTELDRRYGPTVRCAIGTLAENDDPTTIEFFAHGYLNKVGLSIGADSRQAFWNETAQLESVFHRVARVEGRTIQGRHMPSKLLSESLGWDDGTDDSPIYSPTEAQEWNWRLMMKHVPACRCVFNPKGRPNRMRRPVAVVDPASGTPVTVVHLFTYDGDPRAEPWTYLQALRYLWLQYMTLAGIPRVGPGNLFSTLNGPDEDPWWALSESDVLASGTPFPGFVNYMVRNCNSLTVEGMDLLEALIHMGSVCGLRFHETYANVSYVVADVDTWVWFWCPGDVAPDNLVLEKTGSHRSGQTLRSVADVVAHNNVSSATLQTDHASTYSGCKVIGDRKYLQITAELKPGWKPDDRWDDVPEETADALREEAYGTTNKFTSVVGTAFYHRYHLKGNLFASYRAVGQLWLIDPAGELNPDDYERQTGRFTDYAPWTFGDVGVEFPDGQGDDQVRRRRWIKPVSATDDETGKSLGIVLHVSYGDGERHLLLATHRPLTELTAIYLKVDDLLTIGKLIEFGEEADDVDNFYDAYLKGVLRIWATFNIDLDDRIAGSVNTVLSPVATHRQEKVVLRPRDFHDEDTTADPDNEFYGQGDVLDDARIEAAARGHLAAIRQSTQRGNVIIPWVEPQRYPIGTPISGIKRTALGNDDIAFGGAADGALVVGKVFHLEDQRSTELVLEDYGLRKALGPRS